MDEALLRARCVAHGIATGYHEISGRYVEVPASTLASVLRVFGVDPEMGDGAPPAPGVADADAEADAAPVDPIVWLEAGAAGQGIAMRPAGVGIDWRIEEASGAVRVGRLDDPAAGWLALEAPLCAGYHRLALAVPGRGEFSVTIVAAPPRCWVPSAIEDSGRVWGPTVQLYSLRSARNWGIGDFGDLRAIVDVAAAWGADLVGLNPLHALFPHDPARCSPYSPSSRGWLDTLYIDVPAVEEFDGCEEARALVASPSFADELARARVANLVDHRAVSSLKHRVLRLLHRHFLEMHVARGTGRAARFAAFRAAGGEALRAHALFDAIQARVHADDPSAWGWPAWPARYAQIEGEAVARFASEHAEDVGYFEYLQWIAATQLDEAARACEAHGMRVGLYLDLAVSCDPGGSDTWASRDAYVEDIGVGAPPDDFNLDGQDWGLPPLHPRRLVERRCDEFVRVLRASMRVAGALRIDHVMGLARLFWIPRGARGAAGTYVRYPLPLLMAIVALESHINRCMVIGEDLGTVPDEVRAAMAQRGLLSYRLLWFEREWSGEFRAPGQLPRDALVAVGTHDLPTLAGWWTAQDLRVREALGMLPPNRGIDDLLRERHLDRERLMRAAGRDPAEAGGPLGAETAGAIHRMLASAPCRVMAVPLEDLAGEVDQPNLPGTVDQHPNWRRRLRRSVQALADDPRAAWIAAAVSAERGRSTRG